MQLSDSAKNTMLQALAGIINANANPRLLIYIDSTVAVILALPNPVEADVTAGIMSFSAIDVAISTEDGVPTSCEIQDDTGATIATLPASAIELDKPQLYTGGRVLVLSLTVRI